GAAMNRQGDKETRRQGDRERKTTSLAGRAASRLLVSLSPCLLVFCATGCRQDMAQQPRYDPLEESAFFPDGMSARPLTPGPVARGHLRADPHLYDGGTGLEGPSHHAPRLVRRALAVPPPPRHVTPCPSDTPQ